MGEFNLADVLRDANARDLGQPGREQIQYIDIGLIDPDPKNFYELSDLDELAANIELVGLQQPIRVRVHPKNAERYMIVSGHRRRAAIRQLVDEGKDQLRAVPCIVEQPATSEAMQELRLIYANSGTRKLTPAEISKQAERVEMLLYELKEQGMEFPGRMRDHVAEACKVSKSKLSRLKVIREKLSSLLKPFFEEGKIAESTAYELAKHPKSWQIVIWGSQYNRGGEGRFLTEQRVCDAVGVLGRLLPLKCDDGSECANFEHMLNRSGCVGSGAACLGCCRECIRKATCASVCKIVKTEVDAARENARKQAAELEAAMRASRAKKEAERVAENEKAEALNKKLFERLGAARRRAGKTVFELYEQIMGWVLEEDDGPVAAETGSPDVDYCEGPYDSIDLEEIGDIADFLDCSVDYLLCRTDTPQPPMATLESTPVWRDPAKGELPEEDEEVIALWRSGKYLAVKLGVWKDGEFKARDYGVLIPNVLAWQPYCYEDNIVPDSGTETEREETDDD